MSQPRMRSVGDKRAGKRRDGTRADQLGNRGLEQASATGPMNMCREQDERDGSDETKTNDVGAVELTTSGGKWSLSERG